MKKDNLIGAGIDPLEFGSKISPLEFYTQSDTEGTSTSGREIIEPLEFFEKGDEKKAFDELSGSIAAIYECKKGESKNTLNVAISDKVSKIEAPKKGLGEIVKAEEATATNFSVQPVCRYIFIDREGREDSEHAVIESIVVITGISHQITLKVKDIRSLARIVQMRFPEAILDFERKNAEKMLEIRFRNAMRYCKIKYVYFQAGWQEIGGYMRYVRDGMQFGENLIIDTGMTLPSLPCCGGKEIATIFARAMSVYKDEMTMAAIFAFSLTGILYRLFQKAGIPPHFCLFMYGITGSMKTTIAKIFFVQLCEERYRENVRRIDMDTAVSLERAVISAGHDTLTLIDDFSPAKTETKRREMADKLEMIIRMVGDGSSRSRSNLKLEDRRGEGVQGMVALTGELRGKGLSSNLRCIYCEIKKKLTNVEEITWFQENPYAFTTLLAAFSDFVGENYLTIIEKIRCEIGEQRKKISKIIEERRLVDSAAMLCIATQIFMDFLSDKCGQSPKIVHESRKILEDGIIKSALKSQMLTGEESPGVIFIRAVAALMRLNVIILNEEKVKMTEATIYDGFADDSCIYLNPDSIYKKVVAFLRQSNKFFPYELKEILSILANEEIIKTAPNGMGKRTYCVRIQVGNGAKYNFLKIRKSIFDEICNGSFEYESGKE